MSSLLGHRHGEKTHFSRNEKNLSSATERLNDAKRELHKNRRNAQAPHMVMSGQKEGKRYKPRLQGKYPLLGVTGVLY